MISHIYSVTIYVTDQDRALAFYRDALGFEVTMDSGGSDFSNTSGFRWIAVAPRGAQTNLILYKTTPEMLAEFPRVGTHTGLVLYTPDLAKEYEELKSKGVRFTVEPKHESWGGYEGQFADLDGNTFELVQSPNLAAMPDIQGKTGDR